VKSSTAKTKPDPPPATTPAADANVMLSPEFISAQERWRAARLRMRELDRRREQLQVGLTYANLSTDQPEQVRRLVDEFDKPTLAAIKRSPRKAVLELENLIDEIVEAQPAYGAEHELFESAKRAEATRVAGAYVDRHRLAVLGLVAALEAFNEAVEAERSVRRDFARASPEPTSAALPDWSGDFDDLDLLTWHSVGATWARRVRAAGFAS